MHAYKLTVFWKDANRFHQTLVTKHLRSTPQDTPVAFFETSWCFASLLLSLFGTCALDLLDWDGSIRLLWCNAADCMHVVDWLRLVCQTANSRPMRPTIRRIPPLVIRRIKTLRTMAWYAASNYYPRTYVGHGKLMTHQTHAPRITPIGKEKDNSCRLPQSKCCRPWKFHSNPSAPFWVIMRTNTLPVLQHNLLRRRMSFIHNPRMIK